jgi:hypothetical protein
MRECFCRPLRLRKAYMEERQSGQENSNAEHGLNLHFENGK